MAEIPNLSKSVAGEELAILRESLSVLRQVLLIQTLCRLLELPATAQRDKLLNAFISLASTTELSEKSQEALSQVTTAIFSNAADLMKQARQRTQD